jgi:hypothetical protein
MALKIGKDGAKWYDIGPLAKSGHDQIFQLGFY